MTDHAIVLVLVRDVGVIVVVVGLGLGVLALAVVEDLVVVDHDSLGRAGNVAHRIHRDVEGRKGDHAVAVGGKEAAGSTREVNSAEA